MTTYNSIEIPYRSELRLKLVINALIHSSLLRDWKIKSTAFVMAMLIPSVILGNEKIIDQLFLDLQKSDQVSSRYIERRILAFWSDSGSEEVNALLENSQLALRSQNYDLALIYVNKVIETAPEFPEGWNTRATIYYLQSQFDLSIADIVKTLELNERHFGALNGLALIYELKGEVVKALKVYSELYKLTPNRRGVKESIKRLQETLYNQSI